MPSYTYNCPEHGNFDVERSIKDPALEECPKCQKPVTRVYVAIDYSAKCDGFYGKTSK